MKAIIRYGLIRSRLRKKLRRGYEYDNRCIVDDWCLRNDRRIRKRYNDFWIAMRCDRISNRPLPAKEKKEMNQEEFNVALRESTHWEKLIGWYANTQGVFVNREVDIRILEELPFNAIQGHLLAYLREERNIGIKMEIFTDGECGLVYRANLFVFTDCRFNRIPNRNISNSDYNELMKELILIAMNHDS